MPVDYTALLCCDLLTCCVLEDFNRSIVDLSNSLHLNVVAIAIVKPLAVDVVFKVLIRDILREVVDVLKLEREKEREGGREREGEGGREREGEGGREREGERRDNRRTYQTCYQHENISDDPVPTHHVVHAQVPDGGVHLLVTVDLVGW